jgi:hypothetical protein
MLPIGSVGIAIIAPLITQSAKYFNFEHHKNAVKLGLLCMQELKFIAL